MDSISRSALTLGAKVSAVAVGSEGVGLAGAWCTTKSKKKAAAAIQHWRKRATAIDCDRFKSVTVASLSRTNVDFQNSGSVLKSGAAAGGVGRMK